MTSRRVRGYACYPSLAFANHSCLPCVARFDALDSDAASLAPLHPSVCIGELAEAACGDGAACNRPPYSLATRYVAMHALPIGSELTIVPAAGRPYTDRRARLIEEYSFECDCARAKLRSSSRRGGKSRRRRAVIVVVDEGGEHDHGHHHEAGTARRLLQRCDCCDDHDGTADHDHSHGHSHSDQGGNRWAMTQVAGEVGGGGRRRRYDILSLFVLKHLLRMQGTMAPKSPACSSGGGAASLCRRPRSISVVQPARRRIP